MSFPPPTLEHCTRHPDRITGRHCTRCGRPACNDCLFQADVGSHCYDCVRRARPAVREQVRFWNASQSTLATRTLIAINVAVFVWVVSNGSMSGVGGVSRREFDLALAAQFIRDGEWWRLVTAGFLHYGLLHIGMNMLLLFQLGTLLEPVLGRARFTLLYLAALLGGSVGALALSPDALTGGASGAVFGLMAAAAVAMHQRGVNPFRTGIGTTLLLNLLITFTIPGISVGGHLGGALMGAAVGWGMLEPGRNRSQPWVSWAAPVLGILVALALVPLVI